MNQKSYDWFPIFNQQNQKSALLCAWMILIVIALMCSPFSEAKDNLNQDITKDESHHFIHQFVQNNVGTEWYGIYMLKNKVGYAQITLSYQQEPERSFYQIDMDMTMELQFLGVDISSKLSMSEQFDAQAPYALTYHVNEQKMADEVSRVTINRLQNRYEAKIFQGNKMRIKPLGQLHYTFKDALAVEIWLQNEPKMGEYITFRQLNEEKLQVQNAKARIKSIRNTLVDGVPLKYYEVTLNMESLEFDLIVSSDGKSLSMDMGELMTLQLEPKALATRLDEPVDLFFNNLVKIDKTLGEPDKVKLLKLTANGIPNNLMEIAPGQRVMWDKKNGIYNIEITSYTDFPIKATAEEIQEALTETVIYPIHHPDIVMLAKQAIGEATTRKDKVKRLIHFVHEYIEDDYHANPLTVMDIIAKKKGDCTEYAALFVTLARSLGIPSRTVGGLVYMGDKWQAFSPHEWNEVVIDGLWVPVDPAWNEITINATHIRFPVNLTNEARMMAIIPDLKFQIHNIELKN